MNYEQTQFWIKLIVTIVIAVPVIWGIVKIWQRDIDVGRFLNVTKTIDESANKRISWIPEREADAIYQNDKLVAKVSGALVDEANGIVTFDEIYQSNDLNSNEIFEFRKWRLRLKSADALIGLSATAPQKGQIIERAICKIEGTR